MIQVSPAQAARMHSLREDRMSGFAGTNEALFFGVEGNE